MTQQLTWQEMRLMDNYAIHADAAEHFHPSPHPGIIICSCSSMENLKQMTLSLIEIIDAGDFVGFNW
jgi:hypothetical protein